MKAGERASRTRCSNIGASGRSRAGPQSRIGAPMDPVITAAVEDYDRLLREEKGLVEEMDDRLFERMRQAKLTFGGRVLCPFLRPNFVSPELYEQVRGVCRGIMGDIEREKWGLGAGLWDRVHLAPQERELMAIDPGYGRSSPTSRLDAFLT